MRDVSGKSAEHAAHKTGVSPRSVEKALSLEKKKHGTLDRILKGELTLASADKELNSLGKLSGRFVAPPFTVLDARQGDWIKKKRRWNALGIKGGHNEQLNGSQPQIGSFGETSAFDPVLAEFVYCSFAPRGGRVLDPFAGESTKGLVAAKLGLNYTGLELRREQVEENRKRAESVGVSPKWICADSAKMSEAVPTAPGFALLIHPDIQSPRAAHF
jgi:hypothetical protein